MPPPTRHPDDLAAPSPSENTPPRDGPSKFPRRLRPRRRRERQPELSTNESAASRVAGPATQLRPAANQNSAHPSSSSEPPGRGQQPIGIRRFQDSSLEPAGQAWVPQWSIPWPSCAHSTHSSPDSQPMRMQNADLTRTTMKSGGYINRPSTVFSRVTTPAFIETPSLDLASPHLPYSDLIETPSLNRPLGR